MRADVEYLPRGCLAYELARLNLTVRLLRQVVREPLERLLGRRRTTCRTCWADLQPYQWRRGDNQPGGWWLLAAACPNGCLNRMTLRWRVQAWLMEKTGR